ncbi:SGNH/GDSL hydrolase family protein [Hymenobacter armeniacus]|uniref:SGNH/GDSL hydrolase family protein n=1 Tax=Hymenobacter armeniacus TaxID=2771358 RepID=A0ABR8JVG0_9BACT|nr:SGNH/GDSL hydrolase family protein [Hymenobacter armeniacus]MBD2722507.1 SGNH/GDSL hydrolase family protein [Hymenobacter armeniacus]
MRLLAFLLPLLSFTAPVAPAAKPPKKPVVILFVGNSYFHSAKPPMLNYNAAAITDENFTPDRRGQRQRMYVNEPGPWGGVPGIFKKLTDEAGLNYEVHIEAISGQTLKFHYDSALAIIQQPRWDRVIMHDLSTGPLPTRRGGQPERFQEYATKLEQAIHAANPAARVYLYQTWAGAALNIPPNSPYAGLPLDSMTADLHAAYYGLARRNGHIAGVAPAGDAWLRAIREGVAMPNPYTPDPNKMELWEADHRHPSRWGAYLNACVVFGEITGRDPRQFGPTEEAAAALGISLTQAVALQRVAAEQLKVARKNKGR